MLGSRDSHLAPGGRASSVASQMTPPVVWSDHPRAPIQTASSTSICGTPAHPHRGQCSRRLCNDIGRSGARLTFTQVLRERPQPHCGRS